MKNTIVAITLLVIILSACTFRRSYSIRLVQIDSLMSLSPDSAYYTLLLIQARDKNFITQTDDSLIRSVVEYYDVHGNTAMQARAHYFIYMDSLNNLLQSNDILTAEKEVWMQQQQVRYRDSLSRYKYVLFAVIVFGCMAVYCFRKYYKCKYHKNRKVLLELQTASYMQYALFQEQLRRKEKEIELLKNKINNRYIDEKQQVILSEELQVNKGEHAALAKETLLHSLVYVKLNLIITDFKWKDKSDNVLSDNEWKQLIMGVNSYTNNLVSRVSLQYNLSPKHTCLCCLLLLNFSVTHIAYVMHCTRPTVYNSEHDILMKMGEKYEKGKLRELLNNIK